MKVEEFLSENVVCFFFLLVEANLEEPCLSLKMVRNMKNSVRMGDLPSHSINKDILHNAVQHIHIYDLLICN